MPNGQDKPVNLGGTIQGFPVYTPQSGGGVGVPKQSGTPTFEELVANFRPSDKGAGNIPASSFYSGNRYTKSLPYTDTEEMAGQQQSSWDKWGNGLSKMVGTAATTFLNGTLGTIYGIGAMARDGRFASFYDNEVNRSLDDFNKRMEDALPNYYTHAEQDASWYSPKNIMTANFWSDKVVKNLGFSIGAMAGGVAWGAVLKGIGLTGRLIQAGKGLETVEAVENAIATAPKLGRFGALSDALSSLSNQYLKPLAGSILTNADRGIISVMGTMGEASMEAIQNMNDFRGKLIQEYVNTHGVAPQGEDLNEINQYADKIGNFTWGMNVALLSATLAPSATLSFTTSFIIRFSADLELPSILGSWI